MKTIRNKFLCVVLSVCMVLTGSMVVYAADDANITTTVNEVSTVNTVNSVNVDHGSYSISQTDKIVTVTIDPAKGYALSKLKLVNKKGRSIKFKNTAPTEYKTSIKGELEDYKVVCKYRQATMKNTVNELAMKTGEKGRYFKAHIEYVEGSTKTRKNVLDKTVVYTSSNPEVVQVDEKGKLTALKPGYSRITATAEAGDRVESFGYVIVDGDKVTETNHKVGTMQLFVYFSFEDLIAQADVGHTILVFRADEETTINTKGMFKCFTFDEKYYEAMKTYDGTGVNPATHYAVERKEGESDEDYSKRCKDHADELIPQLTEVPEKFTIYPGEICTIGNVSGSDSFEASMGGDFYHLLERHNLANLKLEELNEDAIKNGTIDLKDVLGLIIELGYDLKTGYNPFTGYTDDGTLRSGNSVNLEANRQLSYRDMSTNVCITTGITQIQLDAMIDYAMHKNHFNLLGRNCTVAAVNEWNIVAASSPRLKVSYDYGGITKGFALPLFTQIDIAKKSWYLRGKNAKVEFNVPAFYGQKE